jgi:hypothetical protein
MKYDDLPVRWKDRLATYLADKGESRHVLYVQDFQEKVRLKFEDGSRAFFNFVLVIELPESEEFAVFTEHCGYHIFSTRVAKWKCKKMFG